MEQQVTILPRGLRSRMIAKRALLIDLDPLTTVMQRLDDEAQIMAGYNTELQAAAMHIDIALRKLKTYNEAVNAKFNNHEAAN